jgi:hypothetical protein
MASIQKKYKTWIITGRLQRDVAYLGNTARPKCAGWGGGGRGGGSCEVSASEYCTVQLYTGAQTNFGDLTPYLNYDSNLQRQEPCPRIHLSWTAAGFLKEIGTVRQHIP